MKSLTVLVDNVEPVQEPFLTQFFEVYWDRIALAIPVVSSEAFEEQTYFDVINRGHRVDWLFAIINNPLHPLDVDWVCLRPRQEHPWGYGNHPATDNFNEGGSTVCLYEMLSLIELLSEDDRVAEYCKFFPELYLDHPPQTFSYYTTNLFGCARSLMSPNRAAFAPHKLDRHKFSTFVCLGLYGSSNELLNMNWHVESLIKTGSWTATTSELADKATLALRLSGKSDEFTKIAPLSAFAQWNFRSKNIELEPLLIRMNEDVLLCHPQLERSYAHDAFFLDCNEQTIERYGANSRSAQPTLKAWGLHPEDGRLSFLPRLR
ncbi:hypothetical protein HY772_10245 [Candidatus Woesearchaeota archaeon]|nr:hypothetical protein [Candidatus Woesearchaeota archaeon]